jgi:GNAT superfamily N-acetyltransferase
MTEDLPQNRTPSGVDFKYDEARENAEIAAALGAEVAQRFGSRDETPFSILARDARGALLGGLNGVSHWRWLYIRHLWVAPERRGRGLAAQLLAHAEAKAKARGCVGLYIDTFDPAVAGIYQRRGFTRAGEIEDFPPGAARLFLIKRL